MIDSSRTGASKAVYDTSSSETLLRMALASSWPWDAPTFRHEWIRGASERARKNPRMIVDVRIPWKHRHAHPRGDHMSVSVDEIPGGIGDPIPLYIICASSSSPATVVSNLALAMNVVGSNPDELLPSYETRSETRGGFMHAIACIPSSRVT